MLIQKEIDGWIYTTVEKSQAAGERESTKYDLSCFSAKISHAHHYDDLDGLEQIEGQPGDQKGQNDGKHDFDRITSSGFCTRVCGGVTVTPQVNQN